MSKKITTEQHYKITLKDGSTYYGRTTQVGNRRYHEHTSDVRRGEHGNKYVQESYDKYGYDGWVHEWLGYETGDKQHHNKIEFGYVQADPKALNIDTGRCVLLTNSERFNNKLNNMTPEELKEHKRELNKYYKHRMEKETPEEQEKRLLYDKEQARIRRKNETPKQYELRKQKDREYQQRRRDEKKRSGDNK